MNWLKRLFTTHKHVHEYGEEFWKCGLLVKQCNCGLLDIVRDPNLERLEEKIKTLQNLIK